MLYFVGFLAVGGFGLGFSRRGKESLRRRRGIEGWKVGEEECTNQNVTFYDLVLPLGLIFATSLSFFFLLHVVFYLRTWHLCISEQSFFFLFMTKIVPEVGGISAHQLIAIGLEGRQRKGEI